MARTVIIDVDDAHRSRLVPGYRLSDEELNRFVDEDVEFVVFVDPNRGRYVSTVEDWQDMGINDPDSRHVHLRQSYMNRG